MLVSLEWVSDYVELPADLDPQQIAHDLTLSTVEVESVKVLRESFEHMVVGRVESISAHPNADKLQVIACDVGRDAPLTIVCGGATAVGATVAVALPGAAVRWHGEGELITLATTEIRGVESHGMIAAAAEIGLADLFPSKGERELVDLTELACEPGQALAVALGLDDTVLEIDNKSLTNRPDLWGHFGIARELAAIYNRPLQQLPVFEPPAATAGIEVEITDSGHSSRYTGTRIEGLGAEHTPYWMKSRLVRVGQRPISLAVDLTNYVMLAVGQPSHAFDADRLEGTVSVRTAGDGESLALLTGETVTLETGAIVIADAARPVALAGVMGGMEPAVGPGTTNLFLEVAHFDPSHVRASATALGIRTESSTRFEKGLCAEQIDQALGLFFSLLGQSCPQAKATGFVDVFPRRPTPISIDVTVGFIQRRLGKELAAADISALLERLGFVVDAAGTELSIRVPGWRATGDVSLPEDIVEEVARLYGYENLEFAPPRVSLVRPVRQPRVQLARRLKETLASHAGMQEIVSYPWVGDRFLTATGFEDAAVLSLAAPPSPESSRLQPSLIPQLYAAAAANLRFVQNFRVFELARVFHGGVDQTTPSKEVLPDQPRRLAAALVGSDAGRLFLEAKGVLERLSAAAQMRPFTLTTEGTAPAWAEPSGVLHVELDGRAVGVMAVASSRSLRLAGIRRAQMALFELDVDEFEPHVSRENKFAPISEYPRVDYDLSFLVEQQTPWDSIRRVALNAGPVIQHVEFIDEYRGEQIPADRKSVTLRLHLGSMERTLTTKEVDGIAAAVLEGLGAEFGAELR